MLRRAVLWLAVLSLAACAPAPLAAVTPTLEPTATRPATRVPPLTVTPRATPPASATPIPPTSTDTATAPPTPSPTASALPDAFQPTPDALAATRRVRLPILMYHYIEPWPANADAVRRGLTVRPADFGAQMQYLADHGFVTVSLYDLLDAVETGRALPAKAVVLTFDDGYRSLMDYAAPTLQSHGYTATVFAITDFMDRGLPQYLTWDQARALFARGWRVEPHTKTHIDLAGQSRAKQLYEILGSVETIQANLGVRPRFLCYPSGRYDATTLQVAQDVHLWGAVTTHSSRFHGWADRYTWTRTRIDGNSTLQSFITAVAGDLQP